MFFYNNVPYLLQYSEELLNSKIKSMRNDVLLCLSGNEGLKLQQAPFAALLVCFSNLDFLAALHAGNASKDSRINVQARSYLDRYFVYTERQKDLLMSMYRHKLVHLYQPAHVFFHKGRWYSWRIIHEGGKSVHLKVTRGKRILHPAHFVILRINYVFSVVIMRFLEDIEKSSRQYLEDLRDDQGLQKKFDRAMLNIFSLG